MGRSSYAYLAIAIVAAFFVAGCETVPKKFREEVSGISSKVDTLESRVEGVESKQAEVERTTSQQAQALEEIKAEKERVIKTNFEARPKHGKSREHMKEIQVCLKNAGFYKGEVDGVKGKGTKRAIKEFQTANGLKSDGKVGPKTWELLSKYASGSAAASAVNPAAEGADTK
ncbi:MAG: peptidoglycan-binding domain-containing protein [Candidatus Omnitrophica bacterium]|nr:peptidoglycan-binding domain-containing protein [Candidatus Omnitrophota bacterium]